MKDFIGNTFVQNFGMLNGACTAKGLDYSITKQSGEMRYDGYLSRGTKSIYFDCQYCDDLFQNMIDAANTWVD